MNQDERLRTHPSERLASPVQRVNLAEAARGLRAELHEGTAGHRQLALVRHGPVSLILFAFEKGGVLPEHRADGEVTIHALAGSLSVVADGQEVRIGSGDLISLAPGQPHSVRALDESDMLLTICRVPAIRDRG